MPRPLKWGPIKTQEVISFDGPRVINTSAFDLQQAKEAARFRNRRTGEMATSQRTSGFHAKVGGLWVPQSAGENSAVVAIPRNHAFQAGLYLQQQVEKKYAKDPSISPALAATRAWRARTIATSDMFKKYKGYALDAEQGYLRIHSGLTADGAIDREAIEANAVAYNQVVSYITHLNAFVGAGKESGQRRSWATPKHTRQWASRAQASHNYLQALPRHEFDETVLEAYYSSRCRHVYWENVVAENKQYIKEHTRKLGEIVASEVVGIEYLDKDPQALDAYWIDGEYIGYE